MTAAGLVNGATVPMAARSAERITNAAQPSATTTAGVTLCLVLVGLSIVSGSVSCRIPASGGVTRMLQAGCTLVIVVAGAFGVHLAGAIGWLNAFIARLPS